jgi:hypothetical protein
MNRHPESHASANSERRLRFGKLVSGLAVALKERMHHLQSQAQLASAHQASHDVKPVEEILAYDANGL